ncbi:MAG: FixH family protein [Burkholderiales bacterium]
MTASSPSTFHSALLAFACACGLSSACFVAAPVARDVSVESTLTPAQPTIGKAVLRVRLLDASRRPVPGAQLRVEGHMSHPGMSPVLATATEHSPGIYQTQLQFTMRGDWVLVVTGALAKGAAVNHRIDVEVK